MWNAPLPVCHRWKVTTDSTFKNSIMLRNTEIYQAVKGVIIIVSVCLLIHSFNHASVTSLKSPTAGWYCYKLPLLVIYVLWSTSHCLEGCPGHPQQAIGSHGRIISWSCRPIWELIFSFPVTDIYPVSLAFGLQPQQLHSNHAQILLLSSLTYISCCLCWVKISFQYKLQWSCSWHRKNTLRCELCDSLIWF